MIALGCLIGLVLIAYVISMETQAQFSASLFYVLFLSFPAILGGIVALFRIDKGVQWGSGFHLWAERRRDHYRARKGALNRIFYRPLLWCVSKAAALAESIEGSILRTGVRIAVMLYIFGFALYIAISVVIAILLMMAGFWLLFKLLGWDESPKMPGREVENTCDLYDNRGIIPRPFGRVTRMAIFTIPTGCSSQRWDISARMAASMTTEGFFQKR